MSPKEEGMFYMNMAKKYKDEDGARSLSQFCREENLSYNKLIHLLRTNAYRRSNKAADVEEGKNAVADGELAPLEVDVYDDCKSVEKPCNATGIDLTVGTRYRLRIESCDIHTFGAILRELDRTVC